MDPDHEQPANDHTDKGRALPPGRYGFDNLTAGDTFETGSRAIDGATIDTFAELTRDYFEIHITPEGAKRHGFTDRVAHGVRVLSLIDGLRNQSPQQFDVVASLRWDKQDAGSFETRRRA